MKYSLRHVLLGLLLAQAVPAQSTINPSEDFAYAANAGWIDFRPSVGDGVRVSDTALSGYAYAANFGWVNFGDGTPDNGHTYSNTSAPDYGVNVFADGRLIGFAYAANIGWINFEQSQGLPKIDLLTGNFTGSAYSANVGWIALSTAFGNVKTDTLARTDTDNDGIPDVWERLHFGNLTTTDAISDRDGDGSTDLAEYNAGTLPMDSSSYLRIVSYGNASALTAHTLTFTTTSSRFYRLEYNSDLSSSWTNSSLGTFNPDTGTTSTRDLTGLDAPTKRFFRAVAIQPLPTAP